MCSSYHSVPCSWRLALSRNLLQYRGHHLALVVSDMTGVLLSVKRACGILAVVYLTFSFACQFLFPACRHASSVREKLRHATRTWSIISWAATHKSMKCLRLTSQRTVGVFSLGTGRGDDCWRYTNNFNQMPLYPPVGNDAPQAA